MLMGECRKYGEASCGPDAEIALNLYDIGIMGKEIDLFDDD